MNLKVGYGNFIEKSYANLSLKFVISLVIQAGRFYYVEEHELVMGVRIAVWIYSDMEV